MREFEEQRKCTWLCVYNRVR